MRTGIHELIPVDEELIHGINVGFQASQLKAAAILNGMTTLHQDGMLKVRQEVTSTNACIATVSSDMQNVEFLRMQESFREAVEHTLLAE